ncbi:MAG TPA: phosphate regulon sensor histidine kinase PhoR [Thiotrichales bacterium]|nr:phosphate regulon sensor histidine kinase PhoR [Thiotrichales bacterium]
MTGPWRRETWRLAGVLAGSLFAGILVGQPVWGLLLGVGAYFGWHLWNVALLDAWLRGERSGRQMPDPGGIWGEVFLRIRALQKRNRKRKKKLTRMLERFRLSTNAIPDPTVVLDGANRIEWWNQAAAELLDLSHPHDVGQKITNLIRYPDFVAWLDGEHFDQPLEIPAPVDSRVTLSIRVVPYAKNQRLLVAQDVSRIRLVEQMRRDFIANVSHELRTPLTVIQGYLESLIDADDECSRRWQRELHNMEQQSARMATLVSDLLLLSRLETEGQATDHSPVDVPALLQMLLEDLQALSQGRHHISLEADRDLWLLGDREELRSAFSNLAYNAVHYTPEGGQIRLSWHADAEGAYFEVEDTGIGIDAPHIPRLTERFYRVDVGRSREIGGTGLGLAIVKHVLVRHRGELWISSEPGKGSRFTCAFPPSRIVRQEEGREPVDGGGQPPPVTEP